ncbi:transposase [Oceanirhabdus sp. W0125-5]|uniref:transposase n=1 Tax=Oceanirhabdus sp. W0125-5 TaxID=2999116 RepID=UPI0022F3147C|nr:transposase [Oceanirhabdus sp. W0125-5]WBW98505.1 transposase [Oceanirhabdus sp. W0125-5]
MGQRFVRKFTEEQRMKYVMEVLESGSNISVAKAYDINPKQLSNWVNNYRRYNQTLKPKVVVEQESIPNYKKEYKKMKEMLEEKDLEIAILRDLLKKTPIVSR